MRSTHVFDRGPLVSFFVEHKVYKVSVITTHTSAAYLILVLSQPCPDADPERSPVGTHRSREASTPLQTDLMSSEYTVEIGLCFSFVILSTSDMKSCIVVVGRGMSVALLTHIASCCS